MDKIIFNNLELPSTGLEFNHIHVSFDSIILPYTILPHNCHYNSLSKMLILCLSKKSVNHMSDPKVFDQGTEGVNWTDSPNNFLQSS